MEQRDLGILLHSQDLLRQRDYFKEMTNLLGIKVIYRAPRDSSKHYNGYGELDSFYYEPIYVGCIFEEHPTVKTTRLLGWNTELSDSSSIIHLPYDLDKLQEGALVIVPSGIDNSKGRLFRIVRISTANMIYPASVACEIVPEYYNTCKSDEINDFSSSNFNVLKGE